MEVALLPNNASQEQIEALAKTSPELAVQHPNISRELFAELAKDHPFEAQQNISLPIWQLENPVFWEKIMRENIAEWISRHAGELLENEMISFSLDCVARVLPLYESLYHDDDRPRKLIVAARDLIKKKSTRVNFLIALEAAYRAAEESDYFPNSVDWPTRSAEENKLFWSANAAAWAIVRAADAPGYNNDSLDNAFFFASASKAYAVTIDEDSSQWEDTQVEEYKWQWNYLIVKYHSEKFKLINANDEQIRGIATIAPSVAVQHPNISPALFKALAINFPIEAAENPSLALWILEDPSFWKEIQKDNVFAWIYKFRKKISDKDLLSFYLDCADRVLYLCEKIHPDDKQVRRCINVARRWRDGNASDEEHQKAIENAIEYRQNIEVMLGSDMMGNEAFKQKSKVERQGYYAARLAAYAAVQAANYLAEKDDRDQPSDWASDAMGFTRGYGYDTPEWEDAKAEEQLWQWNHLASTYLEKTK